MKFFNRNPYNRALSTYVKYCYEIDHDILSVCNFIDNFNPNYVILNRKYEYQSFQYSYYSQEQLTQLEILNYLDSDIDNDGNNDIVIYVDKMLMHQIVENTFGKKIYAGYSNENENEWKQVPQGYAVRHDGFKDGKATFTIISLASSGSYYVPTIILENGNTWTMNWTLVDHATDLYGLSYSFSWASPGDRIYYSAITEAALRLYQMTTPITIIPNQSGNNIYLAMATPAVNSTTRIPWTTDMVLFYDILLQQRISNNVYFEEISDDSAHSTAIVRVEERPQSRYIINTNLENIKNWTNILFNFY